MNKRVMTAVKALEALTIADTKRLTEAEYTALRIASSALSRMFSEVAAATGFSSKVVAEVAVGNKIAAIKQHREDTGLSLVQSKEAVDRLQATMQKP